MSLFHIDAGREWRGGQRQVLFLAKELKKRGLPSYLVVQPHSPLYHKAIEADLPLIPVRIRNEFDPLAIIRLSQIMRRKHCLFAHFHDAHSTSVGSVAATLAKVPIKVCSRRVDFPLKQNFFSRWKYRNIDVIIAISAGVKKVLVKSGISEKKIKIIPSGIDFTHFERIYSRGYLRREFSFAKDDYLVGIVAHLADHKGHKYLIQATKFLKEKTDKIKLIVVGEGPLRLELNKQAKELKVDDIVYFLGFREDVPQILNSLDLFVLSSYLEGLGSSILDAMVSGLPVVATKTGGIPEVVIHNETGLLVSPRNPSSLARAILKLYNDRELAARLGMRGYELVREKFSAQTMAGKVVNLYEELARKKGINFF